MKEEKSHSKDVTNSVSDRSSSKGKAVIKKTDKIMIFNNKEKTNV